MRNTVVVLVVAGWLAILSAPTAWAAVPAECGKSYAMLMNGAQPSFIQADGSATLPGALTAAVGVGTISFSPDCSTITGELIFNTGDLETSPLTLSFGPAACLSSFTLMGTGIPCFDGGNHFTAASITSPGPNGNGSLDLKFTAGFTWLNGGTFTGTAPFEFTLQNGLGAATVFGTTVPNIAGFPGPSPILTLTMQRIGTTTTGMPKVPIVYGATPYLGDSVMSCNSYSANLNDPFAILGNPLGIAGSFGSAVGAIQIFPHGNAGPAGGGSLSFNSNGDIAESSGVMPVGTPPPNQNDCPIQILPLSAARSGSQSQFADGASNAEFFAQFGGSPTCTVTFPLGYVTSSVTWGSTEKNAYSIFTGASGIVDMLGRPALTVAPAGAMSTCTLLSNGLTGALTSVVATTAISRKGATVSIPIKVASSSPATCDVEFAQGGVSSDGTCSLSITSPSANVPGNTALAVYSNVQCTCTSQALADSFTGALTITSNTCPVNGAATRMITCKN